MADYPHARRPVELLAALRARHKQEELDLLRNILAEHVSGMGGSASAAPAQVRPPQPARAMEAQPPQEGPRAAPPTERRRSPLPMPIHDGPRSLIAPSPPGRAAAEWLARGIVDAPWRQADASSPAGDGATSLDAIVATPVPPTPVAASPRQPAGAANGADYNRPPPSPPLSNTDVSEHPPPGPGAIGQTREDNRHAPRSRSRTPPHRRPAHANRVITRRALAALRHARGPLHSYVSRGALLVADMATAMGTQEDHILAAIRESDRFELAREGPQGGWAIRARWGHTITA